MLQHTFSEVTVKCFLNLHIRWVTGVLKIRKEIKKNLEILKSWIRIPGTGLLVLCQWNLDSGFQSLVGVRIRWAVFRIPKAKIPGCTSKISGSWIPNAKISRTWRSEIPLQGAKRKYYMTDEEIALLNS